MKHRPFLLLAALAPLAAAAAGKPVAGHGYVQSLTVSY